MSVDCSVGDICHLLKVRRKLVCLHSFVLGMESFENSRHLVTGLISSIRRNSNGNVRLLGSAVEARPDLAEKLISLQDAYNRERAVASEVGFALTCLLFMIGTAVLVYAAVYDASWATLPAFVLIGTYTIFYRGVDRWASKRLEKNRAEIEKRLVSLYPHLVVRNSGLH